ncbi:hypothetical protein E1301_Tti016980 [Triplophysa tibetana]|uniref:Mesothelin-like protein n=1 Tax=Triplophysa tibetana TaxID=1572043 RepID=A0A5A9N8X2_9TELE|nr:hypothetical protein E1301_Tti016980 [Triplophysa tibetana]
MLACKLSSNVTKETWKLFFTKCQVQQLDDALQTFSNRTPSPSNVSLSNVLDVIVDVRIDRLSPQRLRDAAFIGTWFQGRLKPFLPSLSQRSLSCLSTKNLTCDTYRRIVEAFANAVPQDGQDVCKPLQPIVTQKQDLINTEFINSFLSRNNTDDPRCLRDTANSTQWLVRNFGAFSQSAPLKTLQTLNKNFTAMELLHILSLKQLSEFAATPGSLMDPPGVNNVMKYVKDCQLGAFFDNLSPAVQDVPLTQNVKAALIRQIFDRANLSNANTSNEEFVTWTNVRMKPLLDNLTDSLVTPFFDILRTRDCNISLNTVKLLDGIRPSMPINTKNAIYNNILKSIKGQQPPRCYRNNSFIAFINESLLGFGPPPNVTTLLSLVPQSQKIEIVNSISPSELGSYLSQPDVVDSDAEICFIFKNMRKTPEFLENVEVPDPVKRSILPCVWPLALSSDNQTEIDLWFDRRLKVYLKFLNKAVIGSNDTLNATCLSYRKMVNVLGSKSFNASQLSSEDIYNTTIKTYLKTDSNPKCYNVNDTRLNSTSWFVNFIGVNFISFMGIDDLYSFGPESTIKTFSVDPDNIQLFNQPGIQKKVLNRYTELIFLQNPSFDLFFLPSTLQCDAPVSVFTKLNESQTNVILGNFKTSCSGVDPQISTALAGNIKTIDASAIQNLGQESVGLTTVQINKASPAVLISVLSELGNVTGWSVEQSQSIITVLLNGNFKLNSTNLVSLGSLIGGLPSESLATIAPQQILETSRNPVVVKNILAAPEIVQTTYVNQLIKVSSSVSALMLNVPSEMAPQIPRNLLIIPATTDPTVLRDLNNKKWKPEQASLFFDSVAGVFSNPDDLSVDVLQGFTCSRVQKFDKTKTKGLINACRKRKNVKLSESQLTCMYNLIKDDSSQDFVSYPKDMLLYYNYETIPKSNCTSYFTEVGSADISVLSSELQEKKKTLWSNAQGCLNIVGTNITKNDLAVLGNLACVLDKDYIESSDPVILENLKNCKDLSNAQMGAMETVLLKGTSKYGQQSSWNQKTLDDLGILPLYFSKSFWGSFNKGNIKMFLKSFLKSLRTNKTPKVLMKKLFAALSVTTPRAKRSTETCTIANITSIEIRGNDFPFGYDAAQFKACLSADVVRDNLASLCEKIDDDTFQRVILDKLMEISPNGLSESQVKSLGPVSRVAKTEEIKKWNITKSDTLAALMISSDGDWNSSQTQEIITKYLSANNNLSATELNILKGPNLCSLNKNTLKTISSDSIKGAEGLDVSKCSSDDKKVFFSLANTAFPIASANSTLTAYQLVESYLGGADVTYIRNLTSLNVSMTLPTFFKLDEGVVKNLTVPEVKGLLGSNLRDLKTYENQTLVRSWISKQLQSDLNLLNIGLTGGKTNNATPTTIPSDATGIRANEWSFSFTILLLIFTIIKMD